MHSFSPNCTLPPVGVSYVSGPNVRGTFEILWNCLATLFICSWSVLHLNVPAHKERAKQQERSNTKVKAIISSIRRSLPRVEWMFVTLAAPELLVGMALIDLLSARYYCQSIKPLAEEDRVEWEEVHSYYANMGGFAIRFPEREMLVDVENRNPNTAEMNTTSLHQKKDKQINDVHREVRPAQSLTGLAVDEESARVSAEPKVSAFRKRIQLFSVNSRSDTDVTDDLYRSLLPRKASTVLQDTMNLENLEHSSSSGKCRRKPNEAVVEEAIDKLGKKAGNDVVGKLMNFLYHLRLDSDGFMQTENDFVLRMVRKHLPDGPLDNDELLQSEADFNSNTKLNYFKSQVYSLLRLQHEIWIPDAEQLRLIQKWGILNVLPDVSADEIKDRSKSDSIVKGLDVIQVMGFVIKLSKRWLENLTDFCSYNLHSLLLSMRLYILNTHQRDSLCLDF